ncbi:MAG: hypothetical protein AAF086_03015 [Planctomycetota bacterium]
MTDSHLKRRSQVHPVKPATLFPLLPEWEERIYQSPPAIFRGSPFWAWNGDLERDRLVGQFRTHRAMGFGGAHLHARTGLKTPYLGDEFMERVVEVADEAERRGMLVWLYDEDRWPSGYAGGAVTRDPALRCRQLLLTRQRPAPGEARLYPMHHAPGQPVTERQFVAAWALRFEGEQLAASRRIAESDPIEPGETAWYAYREVAPDWPRFNHQQYANLLDPRAVQRFIEVTHERYAAALGDRLGRIVPAIFTDEPQFLGMGWPDSAHDPNDFRLAWVDDLPETYRQRFGEDLLDRLPAVFFDSADETSVLARWRFREHHTQRFVDAFARPISRWCEAHGIALTGHLMGEPDLGQQSASVGEVMRSLRHFQLPGIDMLCDHVEYVTAKQAQSIARQYDRPGVASELYGVTNWDFPFAGHLRQGNWQAALGVTVRVPHLSWYSMKGDAKRDFPASIGGHMPWWREYPVVEDHFARVSVALQTGRPICRVAMLHPIESRWVVESPRSAHAERREQLDRGFTEPLGWMLEGQIDVDLLSESLLPELVSAGDDARLGVGAMSYDVVVVPSMVTIRSTTLDALKDFVSRGGAVIQLDASPRWVDGVASDRASSVGRLWTRCGRERAALLSALEPWREVEVRSESGAVEGPIYQLREEGEGRRILFVCQPHADHDLHGVNLRVRGRWRVESLDTGGSESEWPGETWRDDWTCFELDLPVAGHALLRLHLAAQPVTPRPRQQWRDVGQLDDQPRITLDEPNVLMLNRPAWRLDGGSWQPETEVLRIDRAAREMAGLPAKINMPAQPWVEGDSPSEHVVELRYTIGCDAAIAAPTLAVEGPRQIVVGLDGDAVTLAATGTYVDQDIPTFSLPRLGVGEHTLRITLPLGRVEGIEACYLLGDFGVSVEGASARIESAPRSLAFGDWTRQGLPFYGGNVTYHCRGERPGGPVALRVPEFAAPLVAVETEAGRVGTVIGSPYRLALPLAEASPMSLDIIAFGDRQNTFGPLHNANPDEAWWGPEAYRTTGKHWSDAYVLHPKGILCPPRLEQRSP